jgi:hypothetical protein
VKEGKDMRGKEGRESKNRKGKKERDEQTKKKVHYTALSTPPPLFFLFLFLSFSSAPTLRHLPQTFRRERRR